MCKFRCRPVYESMADIEASPEESNAVVTNTIAMSAEQERDRQKFVYQDAAIFLQQGLDNEKFESHPTQENLRWYMLAHSTCVRIADVMASLLILELGFSEKPSSDALPEDSNVLNLAVPVHASLEIVALFVLGVGLALRARSQGLETLVAHKRTLLKLVVLVVMFSEAIVVLVRNANHIRVTRALRPLFLIDSFYFGGTRRVVRQILKSLPPILDMLFLLLFFMLVFTSLGFYLFSANEKDMYFESFGQSFVSLFVLLTTANYPDVMMPSYAASRWSIIFFATYISLVLYLLMNLLLAVVYATFINIQKEKFKNLLLHKREAVRKAFLILCSKDPPHKITCEDFIELMSFFKPKHTDLEKYLVFRTLRTRQSGGLSLDDCYGIFDCCEMEWKKVVSEEQDKWFYFLKCRKRCCGLYHVLSAINWLVTRKFFEFGVYFIIFLNAATLGVDIYLLSGTPQSERGEARIQVYWYHVVFLSLYGLEAMLKIIGLGVKAYFSSESNVFDFLVTVCGALGSVVRALSFSLCLRPFRLLLLFKLKPRYRDVLSTVADLGPRMLRVTLVIILLYYSFGIIGMECFFGLELRNCCKNTSVEVAYADEGYYHLNNFDDLRHSYVTLFELTVVNNWFIIMEGMVYMTSDWSRIYFMSFYIVTMIVMTIVVAFILEAFLFRIQYRKEHPKDDEEDKGIRTETSVTVVELDGRDPTVAKSLEPGQKIFHVVYRGRRRRTKMDLSVSMYKDEIEKWIQNENGDVDDLLSRYKDEVPPRTSSHGVMNEGAELEEIPNVV